jgi:hypothetical protein
LNDGESPTAACQGSLRTAAQLARYVRAGLATQLYDDSGELPDGIAIYSLSDPRDIRAIRYVGQTLAPRRRLSQHLATARLWLPEQTPWWVKSPKLRPLYRWIRELYEDEGRLPVMVVHAWVEPAHARRAERERIQECLAGQLPLLNVENERLAVADSAALSGRPVSRKRGAARAGGLVPRLE